MLEEARNHIKNHPADTELAGYLDNTLSRNERAQVEEHITVCNECLNKAVCAYESVRSFRKGTPGNKRKVKPMGKINLYLILAIISFTLSFIVPRFFLQLLAATLLLGTKWITDSRTTKMLVMIHEAWKKGGEHEASEVIKRFDSNIRSRKPH